jgi:hypothetical protein
MPSPHLRKAQVIIRRYCAELGVAYPETGLITSNRQPLASLHRVAAPLHGTGAASWSWLRAIPARRTGGIQPEEQMLPRASRTGASGFFCMGVQLRGMRLSGG